ncbi:MAG: helix-turn-helix transcriptional regulator [Pseudomonadota bacterium]
METVTLDRKTYNELVEAKRDLEDILAFDRAVAVAEEGLPHAFMKQLIDGQAPVLVFRRWRAFTVSDLSRKSGVSEDIIEGLEKGGVWPTVETLQALSNALDVQMDDLVQT